MAPLVGSDGLSLLGVMEGGCYLETPTLTVGSGLALSYSDIAIPTVVGSGISSTTPIIPVQALVGYPPVPFAVTLDYGNPLAEPVIVTDTTVNSLIVTRGADGVAYPHGAGAPVVHTVGAAEYNGANEHYVDTAADCHTNYLNALRHASTGLHQAGVSILLPTTPPSISLLGAQPSQGVSTAPALSDHVHGTQTLLEVQALALPPGVIMILPCVAVTTPPWLGPTSAQLTSIYSSGNPLIDRTPSTVSLDAQQYALAPSQIPLLAESAPVPVPFIPAGTVNAVATSPPSYVVSTPTYAATGTSVTTTYFKSTGASSGYAETFGTQALGTTTTLVISPITAQEFYNAVSPQWWDEVGTYYFEAIITTTTWEQTGVEQNISAQPYPLPGGWGISVNNAGSGGSWFENTSETKATATTWVASMIPLQTTYSQSVDLSSMTVYTPVSYATYLTNGGADGSAYPFYYEAVTTTQTISPVASSVTDSGSSGIGLLYPPYAPSGSAVDLGWPGRVPFDLRLVAWRAS